MAVTSQGGLVFIGIWVGYRRGTNGPSDSLNFVISRVPTAFQRFIDIPGCGDSWR